MRYRFLVLGALITSGVAQAQDSPSRGSGSPGSGVSASGSGSVASGADSGEYEGVIPGRGAPPAARRIRGGSVLTWPGFTMRENGGSRFFVQTTERVLPTLAATDERVEVLFHHTSVHLRNSRRWLDTRHFNTPVRRARLERRGQNWALVLYLRTPTSPVVTSSEGEGGFFFTYIDFPAGDWNPDAQASSMQVRLSDSNVPNPSERNQDAP